MKLSIIGARVIDPSSGLDQVSDLHLEAGKIVAIGAAPAGFGPVETLDAKGLVAALNVALREPGYSRKGSIASETRAAAAGGVTSLCCPPRTKPVLDTSAVAELILDRAREAGNTKVFPIGALSKGLEGEQLETGVRAHFSQLTSARGVALIAQAQARGLRVTADVALYQLILTDEALIDFSSLYHVQPPLRTRADRDGLREAVKSGVVSAISSHHQPHERDAKLAQWAPQRTWCCSIRAPPPWPVSSGCHAARTARSSGMRCRVRCVTR